jgi:hypothetical protein
MNWKLIFLLSLFGLAMGIATVLLIPSNIEPAFWLVIFLVCAYFIAKRSPGKHFLHGLCLGLVNCFWVTGAHVLFFNTYLANHAREAVMMSIAPLPVSPRLTMALFGTLFGLMSGIVLGLFAWVAGKFVKPSI